MFNPALEITLGRLWLKLPVWWLQGPEASPGQQSKNQCWGSIKPRGLQCRPQPDQLRDLLRDQLYPFPTSFQPQRTPRQPREGGDRERRREMRKHLPEKGSGSQACPLPQNDRLSSLRKARVGGISSFQLMRANGMGILMTGMRAFGGLK